MINYLSKQKWTRKQKEIWKSVEKYTKLIMKGDLEGFFEFFHVDYSSWNCCELLPVNITDIKNELLDLPKREIVDYTITPIVINVFKDVAIVHYYYSAEFKNEVGKEKVKRGRNTDILIKQKERWVLIYDHAKNYGEIDRN